MSYLGDLMHADVTAPAGSVRDSDTTVRIESTSGTVRVSCEPLLPSVELPYVKSLTRISRFSAALQVSGYLSRALEHAGALMLHASFIRDGRLGVALPASGGTGKTTAARRVPQPWSALCDDAVLIVPDAKGSYWAHPWPTWSVIFNREPDGTWPIRDSSPVTAVAFIGRGATVDLRPLGPAAAAVRATTSAEQLAAGRWPRLPEDTEQAGRVLRFESACSLAAAVPSFTLTYPRHADFWTPLRAALAPHLQASSIS